MGKKAFTLIELLVVIAIIAILMSILMPALRAAKIQAQALHCQANIRTLCLAWLMYKDDYDDKIPWSHTQNTWRPDDWAHGAQSKLTLEEKLQAIKDGALFRYVKKVAVYRCPADQGLKNPTQFVYRSFSIANGANGEDWPGDCHPARKYTEIKNPATKYVFVEDIDPRGEDLIGSWQIYVGHVQWIDPLAMWHKRRTTLGYADGHSEMHKWHDKSFIDWCQQAMDKDPDFQFEVAPPANEREDYNFMAKGFPCKSVP